MKEKEEKSGKEEMPEQDENMMFFNPPVFDIISIGIFKTECEKNKMPLTGSLGYLFNNYGYISKSENVVNNVVKILLIGDSATGRDKIIDWFYNTHPGNNNPTPGV